MIWTELESDLYLIAACLPTYRPVLKRFLGNITNRGDVQQYDYNYKTSKGALKGSEERDRRSFESWRKHPKAATIIHMMVVALA